jgi:hypothetical protein
LQDRELANMLHLNALPMRASGAGRDRIWKTISGAYFGVAGPIWRSTLAERPTAERFHLTRLPDGANGHVSI